MLTIVEDDADSDDAIIDEFLPSMSQTTIVTALTSALSAEPPSDDDLEPGHNTSIGQLTPTLDRSRNHSDDGNCMSAFWFMTLFSNGLSFTYRLALSMLNVITASDYVVFLCSCSHTFHHVDLPLSTLISCLSLNNHLYADDT